MSLNTFDKTQTQYERKLARQKQLDMMEAAASGVSPEALSSSARSTPSSFSNQQSGSDGGVGSARRFLWDADDEEYKNVPSRAFTGGAEADQDINLNGHSQRGSGFGLPSFSATTGMEADHSSNISPRRNQSAWLNDASPSADAEEYLEDVRFGRHKRGGVVSCIGSCCLGTFHTFVGAFALLAECLTGKCTKRSCLMVGILVALVAFAVTITAIVKSTNSDDDIPEAPELDNSILDPMRFNAIRQVVLESGFSTPENVDTNGTAQNLAIRWLTDDDPGNLEPDHVAMLQRYALATFFFSTYVSSEYQEEQATDDAYQNASDYDFEWANVDHWMTDKGICMWFGVTCPPLLHEGNEQTVYNGNSDVLHLNLTENNIRGTIPPEIAALENLITLDLGRNNLEGTIPNSIATMPDLGK